MKSSIDTIIKQTIEDPTHEMRTAFSTLPSAHRWLLFALAEIETQIFLPLGNVGMLEDSYNALCPNADYRPYEAVSAELSEGFLTKRLSVLKKQNIDWIHPSCRDLTIDELSRNMKWRRNFLSRCSLPGIELAVSLGGGAKGERSMPLLINQGDWRVFRRRCEALQKDGSNVLAILWTCYTKAEKEARTLRLGAKLDELYDAVCRVFCMQLSAKRSAPWTWAELAPILQARPRLAPQTKIPGLARFWKSAMEEAKERFESESTSIDDTSTHVFIDIVRTAKRACPQFFDERQTVLSYRSVTSAICEKAQSDADASISIHAETKRSSLELEKKAYDEMAGCYKELLQLPNLTSEEISDLRSSIRNIESTADSIQEKLDDFQEPENPGPEEVRPVVAPDKDESSGITLERLLEDL